MKAELASNDRGHGRVDYGVFLEGNLVAKGLTETIALLIVDAINGESSGIVKALKECRHESTSLQGEMGTLVVCFQCGSTKRVGADYGEPRWRAPHAWRNDG